MPCTTAPPTTGPNATARPPIPPQAPSARPRFSGGTAALRMRQRQRRDDRAAEALHRARDVRAPRRRARAPRAAEASVKIAERRSRTCAGGRSGRRAPRRSAAARRRSACRRSPSTRGSRATRRGPTRITGIAVVTTRLSSVTMKSATEVIANVQQRPVLAGHHRSSSLVTSHCSLTIWKKRVSPRHRQPAISRSRPRLGSSKSCIAAITLSSIPLAKKARSPLGDSPDARSTQLDEVAGPAPRRPRARRDRRSRVRTAAVRCSRVRSSDQPDVGLAHGVQRLLAAACRADARWKTSASPQAAARSTRGRAASSCRRAGRGRAARCRRARRSRRSRRRGGPCRANSARGRVEDLLAPLVRRLACRRRTHR